MICGRGGVFYISSNIKELYINARNSLWLCSVEQYLQWFISLALVLTLCDALVLQMDESLLTQV